MDPQKIQLIVPANLHHSSLIRHVSDEIFKSAKFSKSWSGRLKLVVDELFMNAVRYGSTEYKSSIYITFVMEGKSLEFIIEDDGTGPQAIPAEELQKIIQQNEQNTDLARTSGRGLSMITKTWTDGLFIAKSPHGGMRISFKKKIETEDVAPSVAPSAPVQIARRTSLANDVTREAGPAQVAREATGPAPLTTLIPPTIQEKISIPAEQRSTYEIKFSGEIDQSNILEKTSTIAEKLNSLPSGVILILDFTDLNYINSIFIGHLAAWYTILRKKQGELRFRNLNPEIKEVLELVGLLKVVKTE